MKNSMPYTDYDFFVYIVSGIVVLSTCQLIFGFNLVNPVEGINFSSGLLLFVGAYILGHFVSTLSSLFLEHLFARKILHTPTELILKLKEPRRIEKFIAFFLGNGKGYKPIPEFQRKEIFSTISNKIKRDLIEEINQTNGNQNDGIENIEDIIFHVSFRIGQSKDDSNKRIVNFRNQYNFCRNMSFLGLITLFFLIILGHNNSYIGCYLTYFIPLFTLIIFTLRFLKFYGLFVYEVIFQIWEIGKHTSEISNSDHQN